MLNNQIKTEKALVLSTGHMPDPIPAFPPSIRRSPHEYGWILFMSSAAETHMDHWFYPILQICQEQDVSFLIFDTDGEFIDGLKTYTW